MKFTSWNPHSAFFRKAWMIMRISTLLILITALHVSAYTGAQNVTISGNNMSLEEFFNQLKKQTGYSFLFKDGIFPADQKVAVNMKDVPLETALDIVLKPLFLSYQMDNKIVYILTTAKNSQARTEMADPPSIDIHGRVTDSLGNPLAGASVTVKGSKQGTSTNNQGEFVLTGVNENATLIFSYTGYTSRQIHSPGSNPVMVFLNKSNNPLDEVQVIAYGTTTQRLTTGDLSTVKSEDIERQPVSNPLAALEGRVPGLVVTQTTGLPGGSFKVNIRGRTSIDRSISSDEPLFIVDGIPFAANNGYLNVLGSSLGVPSNNAGYTSPGGLSPFNTINPQDIESITILKDADATAIYGSRGANGVVLITTKKGRAGKAKTDANFYTGWNFAHPVYTLNTQQYLAMRRQGIANDGDTVTMGDIDINGTWDTTRYTNFPKFLDGNTAYVTNAQLSLSGGSANTQFLISGGYNRQTTPMPGDFSDTRGSLNFNINHSSTDNKFKFNFSSIYAVDKNNLLTNDLATSFYYPPNNLVYDDQGNLAWNEGGQWGLGNPVAALYNKYLSTSNNLLVNTQLSYQLFSSLVLRANLGYNTTSSNETALNPAKAQNPLMNPQGYSSFGKSQFDSWIIEPQAEFTHDIGLGRIDFLAGATLQSSTQTSQEIDAYGYGSDNLLQSIGAATDVFVSNSSQDYRYQAIFGRINYNWRDKYILNLTGRRDGSSRFAPENRYANFGSVGAAWIFTNESWIDHEKSFLSFGKIRGSYGNTGNDKISNYKYLDAWTFTSSPYNGSTSLYPSQLYNKDYHWELTKKLEFGIELGFIKDRILLNTSWYQERSSNQLVSYILPQITGFYGVVKNLPAEIENKGWEITLTTVNIKNKDFSWTTNANISIPRNRLISFPGLATSSYAFAYVEGQSMSVINKVKYTGVDPNTGLYTFDDKNKDGNIGFDDFQVLGDTDPRFHGGIQNTFTYKNFQFDFFFSFVKQTGVTYLGSPASPPGTFGNNLAADMPEFWTKPGDHTSLQKLSGSYGSDISNNWALFSNISNGVYGDASFIRLKNISLSYNFSKRLMNHAGIKDGRIYVQGQNIFTITGYKIGDPETQSMYRTSPPSTLVIGLQLTL